MQTTLEDLMKNAKRLYQEGQFAESERFAQEAVDLAESTCSENKLGVLQPLKQLKAIYWKTGAHEKSISVLKRIYSLVESHFGERSSETAAVLYELAQAYCKAGRFEEAAEAHRRALETRREILGSQHPDVGISLQGLAQVYLDQAKYAGAEILFKVAARILARELGARHAKVLACLNDLQVLYQHLDRQEEAETLMKQLLRLRIASLGIDHPDTAMSLQNLGSFYIQRRQYLRALPILEHTRQIWERTKPPDHPYYLPTCLDGLAYANFKLGKTDKALKYAKTGLSIRERALGRDHPDVAQSLSVFSRIYTKEAKWTEAEEFARRCLAIRTKAFGEEHPDVAEALHNLGIILTNQGHSHEAGRLLSRALAIAKKFYPETDPRVKAVLCATATLCERAGRISEGHKYRNNLSSTADQPSVRSSRFSVIPANKGSFSGGRERKELSALRLQTLDREAVDRSIEEPFIGIFRFAAQYQHLELASKLLECRHKMYAAKYHLTVIARETAEQAKAYKKQHIVTSSVQMEKRNPVLIYETEAFLMQVKSNLDFLILALKSLIPCLKSFRTFKHSGESGQPSHRSGGRVISTIKKEKELKLARILEFHQIVWIEEMSRLRDIIAHEEELKGFSCFVEQPYLGKTTVEIHYPTMPSGERVDTYCQNTFDNLLQLYQEAFAFIRERMQGKFANGSQTSSGPGGRKE